MVLAPPTHSSTHPSAPAGRQLPKREGRKNDGAVLQENKAFSIWPVLEKNNKS